MGRKISTDGRRDMSTLGIVIFFSDDSEGMREGILSDWLFQCSSETIDSFVSEEIGCQAK
jgi:HD superfamily phosphohydrolase YqeK